MAGYPRSQQCLLLKEEVAEPERNEEKREERDCLVRQVRAGVGVNSYINLRKTFCFLF